ncbi:KDM1B [Symbiodinium sp. CCMP2456]|nr:KDM1B [Symbiodinium sp. CCMP2456]
MERPCGRTKEEANIHRTLQVSIAISVGATEAGKVAWSRWLNVPQLNRQSLGAPSGTQLPFRWPELAEGRSVPLWDFEVNAFYFRGSDAVVVVCQISLLKSGLQSAVARVLMRIRWAHAGIWLLLSLLGAADLALNIGAGGARVSLPLVLFAITECGYVFRMVLPWLHFVLASLALMILLVVLLLPVLMRLTRAAPECRVPWACKLALGVYCGGALWRCRSASQGVGADLLSQLSSDALAMLTGTLLPVDSREVLASHGTTFSTATTFFPPILLFHWEAGADILLDRSNASATPYLRRLVQRPDVFSGSAIAGVPVTLKTAWEARFFVGCQHLPLPIFVSKARLTSAMASLVSFDEMNPKAVIASPRSLQACKQEGVLPQELVFKPFEAFQDRNLSPRLQKLRFDFFEAKRRDLLAAARRARDSIMSDEHREKESSNQQLALVAKESGLSKGAILALNSDTLKLERQKLLRAQETERSWLKSALNSELHQLKQLESANQTLSAEAEDRLDKIREQSRKMKEMNDKRAEMEERKQMEMEARQKLEKQLAKEEFHKQQLELQNKQKEDAKRLKEAYERQVRDAERKRQIEREKAEKREQEARDLQARKEEMRAQDQRRIDLMAQKQEAFRELLRDRKDARDMKIYNSIQANQDLEHKRREDFERKQSEEMEREERLMQALALKQEESAKRSFQTMMRRKVIQEEATRKAEERRGAILDQQEETEYRLMEHDAKKERYLDFKRELDALRAKNKDINVERQRRREDAEREAIAEAVKKKDEKIDHMHAERHRMWELRRAAQAEAYKARAQVKDEILRQRIASKFDSKKLEVKLESVMQSDLFSAKETIVAEDEHGLLEKLRQLLASWRALNASSPAFVYFYGGDAHPPYYANRVETSERGFAVEELMDVFLALNRRTDAVAKRLSEFWPPPRKASSRWQKENGLAFTFGDHGEQLSGADPPPHGNLVSPDVSRTMMAFEARSFASRVASPGLFRMADVYATIADLVGLELKGKLFVGTSLFGKLEAQSQSRRFGVASFSFYRPGDLAAAHFRASDGQICAAEFHRGSQGRLFARSLRERKEPFIRGGLVRFAAKSRLLATVRLRWSFTAPVGGGQEVHACQADPSSTCANESMAALSWALKQRQAMNTLLTAVLPQFTQHACDLEAVYF